MNRERSLKEIEKMMPMERYEAARKKLLSDKNEGAVPALLNHLKVHENTQWLVYSPRLVKQIRESHGAHAFVTLQYTALHYEIIRLCTFWDPIDLDSRSLPTIVALADCRGVSKCVYDDHVLHFERMKLAEAKTYGKRARRRLRSAIGAARQVESSDALRNAKNFRNRLAHQIEVTRLEKSEPVPLPVFGDERKLLRLTVSIIRRLHFSLNGVALDFQHARKIQERNAEAFWKGVRIDVLR